MAYIKENVILYNFVVIHFVTLARFFSSSIETCCADTSSLHSSKCRITWLPLTNVSLLSYKARFTKRYAGFPQSQYLYSSRILSPNLYTLASTFLWPVCPQTWALIDSHVYSSRLVTLIHKYITCKKLVLQIHIYRTSGKFLLLNSIIKYKYMKTPSTHTTEGTLSPILTTKILARAQMAINRNANFKRRRDKTH